MAGSLPRLDLGPLGVVAGLVLVRQPIPGPGQSLPPLGSPRQRLRRDRPRLIGEVGVLGRVGLGCLGEQLLDLRQRAVRRVRRVTGQLRAVQAQLAQRDHALRGQQPQHLTEQLTERLLMPRPEPGDRRVIRVQPGDDQPVGHVAHAPLLDHPAGPLALAVAVQQQGDHHRRVVRRPAVPIGPIAAAKRIQVQRVHRIQHDEHQVVFGQPVPHVHRHQQRLITLRVKEVLRHTP